VHPYRTSVITSSDEQAPESAGLPLAFGVLTTVSLVQVVSDLGRPVELHTVVGATCLIAGLAGLVTVKQRPLRRLRWRISNS
jgi:hypothetical protein